MKINVEPFSANRLPHHDSFEKKGRAGVEVLPLFVIVAESAVGGTLTQLFALPLQAVSKSELAIVVSVTKAGNFAKNRIMNAPWVLKEKAVPSCLKVLQRKGQGGNHSF